VKRREGAVAARRPCRHFIPLSRPARRNDGNFAAASGAMPSRRSTRTPSACRRQHEERNAACAADATRARDTSSSAMALRSVSAAARALHTGCASSARRMRCICGAGAGRGRSANANAPRTESRLLREHLLERGPHLRRLPGAAPTNAQRSAWLNAQVTLKSSAGSSARVARSRSVSRSASRRTPQRRRHRRRIPGRPCAMPPRKTGHCQRRPAEPRGTPAPPMPRAPAQRQL